MEEEKKVVSKSKCQHMVKPKVPKESDGWKELFFLPSWRLFIKDSVNPNFVDVKIIYTKPRMNKANYRLSWTIDEGRFVEGRDYHIFSTHLPGIKDQAAERLWSHYY